MNFDQKDQKLTLDERLDAAEVSRFWALLGKIPQGCTVDASRLQVSDGAGLAFLWSLQSERKAQITGLRPEI
ncbi:MAG: STAS domain-containing protein, partial [Terrimicrobiaceae bacterium]